VIPVDRLHHVKVVVRDLKATARNYALIYGIHRWDVVHFDAQRLSDTTAFGFEAEYTYSTATGSNAGGVTFRLVQPTGGLSTYAEFLVARGEGIHGPCLSVLDEARFQDLVGQLRAEQVTVGQAATVDGAARHYHLDTRKALGGFYVEIVVPLRPDWENAIRVDEHWDFSPEVEPLPGAEPVRDVEQILHFGVVVRSVMERLPAYARLFGLTDWSLMHFRPEPGSLERSTLNGVEVKHGFLLARQDPDFLFEVLQSTMEPTHYRREFMDRVGEGIHHLLLLRSLREEQWLDLRHAMESIDVRVAMSGCVRGGSAEFFYLDTRERLGGYLVEAICRYAQTGTGAPPPSGPDYTFDFSKPA
jgi:hypothetical protein